MADPIDVADPAARLHAFRETVAHVSRRIDLFLALPFESLERRAFEERVQRIGRDAALSTRD